VTNGVAGKSYYYPAAEGTLGQFTLNSTKNSSGMEINDFGEGFSFSMWVRIPSDAISGNNMFVKHEMKDKSGFFGGSDYMQYQIVYNHANNNELYFRVISLLEDYGGSIYPLFNGSNLNSSLNSASRVSCPNDDNWHHYAFVNDGMYLRVYLDGVCKQTTRWPMILNAGLLNVKRMTTGFGNNIQGHDLARGAMDEYRLERVGRSDSWIKACYDNLRPDSTFVSVGTTEGQGMILLVR
jgi:hypothetical protein